MSTGSLKVTKRSSSAREEQRRRAMYLVNSRDEKVRSTVDMTSSEAAVYFNAITTRKSGQCGYFYNIILSIPYV